MALYDKVSKMNTIHAIWRYTRRFRVTYVNPKWFVVWDHNEHPPTRYDCQGETHHLACTAVVDTINNYT